MARTGSRARNRVTRTPVVGPSLKSAPLKRREAAWLYAQFAVAKTVAVEKSHVRQTFVRDSTIGHQPCTERAPELGGLVEFYRSPQRVLWPLTGVNVPDYPRLAQSGWQQLGDVNPGAFTPQQAMDRLAAEMDQVMARMQAADEKTKINGGCGPPLHREQDASVWLNMPGSPQAEVSEKPKGETVDY